MCLYNYFLCLHELYGLKDNILVEIISGMHRKIQIQLNMYEQNMRNAIECQNTFTLFKSEF